MQRLAGLILGPSKLYFIKIGHEILSFFFKVRASTPSDSIAYLHIFTLFTAFISKFIVCMYVCIRHVVINVCMYACMYSSLIHV